MIDHVLREADERNTVSLGADGKIIIRQDGVLNHDVCRSYRRGRDGDTRISNQIISRTTSKFTVANSDGCISSVDNKPVKVRLGKLALSTGQP